MVCSSAVILVLRSPDHASVKPLMLQNVLFSSAARELSLALERFGMERFFVVCEDDLMEETAASFPAGSEIVSAMDEALDERLMAFAAESEGKVLTVTAPMWLSSAAVAELMEDEFINPAEDAMGVFRVDAEILAQGGIETLNYGEFYSPLNDPDIRLLLLRSPADLMKARGLALVDHLYRLAAQGADIIDPNTIYAEAGAEVGEGTILLPGTILRGSVKIGKNCEIGPNAMLTDCIVEDGCVINASQVKNATVKAGTVVGPFQYICP